MSLKLRTAVLTALALAATVGIVAHHIMSDMQETQQRLVRQWVISQADYISAVVQPMMQRCDINGLKRTIKMPPIPGLISISITNANGIVITGTSKISPGTLHPYASRSLKLRRPFIGPIGFATIGAVPIVDNNGRLLGSVVVGADTRIVQTGIDHARRQWVISVIVGSLIGLVLAYLLAAYLTAPLINLISAIRRLSASGATEKLPHSGIKELDDVSEAFNNMSEVINRRTMNLESLNAMAAEVTTATGLTGIAEATYKACNNVLSTGCRLWIYDPYKEEFKSAVTSGMPDRITANPDSPVVMSARQSRLLTVSRVDGDLPSGTLLSSRHEPSNAAIIVPLVASGGLVGVLTVEYPPERDQVSQEEVSLAVALTNIVSSAVSTILRTESQARSARMLQQILVPVPPADVEGIEVAAVYRPAEEMGRLGGDYFDFIKLPDGRWCFVIGDVSGKGLPAAQYAALAKHVIRSYVLEYGSAARALQLTNSALLAQTDPEKFITLFCSILNTDNHLLQYARAGHPPPIVYRPVDSIHRLMSPGPVAGIFPDARFEEYEELLQSGDVLVLYTDGIIESRSDGLLFEEQRLIEAIIRNSGLSSKGIAEMIVQEVTDFAGGRLKDDTAVVVIKMH